MSARINLLSDRKKRGNREEKCQWHLIDSNVILPALRIERWDKSYFLCLFFETLFVDTMSIYHSSGVAVEICD